jgi:hypothetical protein
MEMTVQVLYPEVEVELSGSDGNAFAVLGKVKKALKSEVGQDAADKFMKEATSGDYDHLLQTCFKFVTVN